MGGIPDLGGFFGEDHQCAELVSASLHALVADRSDVELTADDAIAHRATAVIGDDPHIVTVYSEGFQENGQIDHVR